MPKKILFESAVHQFLTAASRLRKALQPISPADAQRLATWVNELRLEHGGSSELHIAWQTPSPGEHTLEFRGAKFYTRGDTAAHAQRQAELGLADDDDRVMLANRAFFEVALREVLASAKVIGDETLARASANVGRGHPPPPNSPQPAAESGDPALHGTEYRLGARIAAEEAFHDEWAAHEDIAAIDVRKRNEACTAPEMRHLRAALGDLRGRTLLDIGCGLGEASVYFALQGARVTATDLSPGMCAVAQKLAEKNGVAIETHVSAAEDLRLGERQFDVIYIGNTLHHVDVQATMERLLRHLKPGGTFVSWDPVAYNPVINVYRRMASEVRTVDEHPLRLRDVRAITSRFETAEVRWFWLSTLLIFVWMAAVQRRSPNRERYWKKVIDEADRWENVYRPLERLDAFMLRWLPFLRPLCWNVTIVARGPRPSAPHG